MRPVIRGILIGVVALFVAMIAAGKEPASARALELGLQDLGLEEAIARISGDVHCSHPKQRKHRCHHVARSVTVTSDIRPQLRFSSTIVALVGLSFADENAGEARTAPGDGRHLRLGFREIYAATRRMHS